MSTTLCNNLRGQVSGNTIIINKISSLFTLSSFLLQDHNYILHFSHSLLAYSIKQLIETVDKLETSKIGLLSLTEIIDTTTSGGKLTFHIFAALSKFEHGITHERTIAGLQAARFMGKTGGRPVALKLADLVAAKALLKNLTITVEAVARRLGIAPSTLYRHLPGGHSALDENLA